MWKAQFIPPSCYESHEFQFHLVVEVLPVDLEGSTWALSLEEQVELVMLVFFPWVLPKVSIMDQYLVLIVHVHVEE